MNLRQFITEKKKSKETFGCAMLEASLIKWKSKIKSIIDKDDLHPDEGFEDCPHVTVLFGIHEDNANPDAVIRILQSVDPLRLTISHISIFENEEYDVVKFTVPKDKSLVKLRKALMDKFDHTVTYPDYIPHMTIAYVKKGCGKKYVGKLDEPFEVCFDTALYSHHTEPGNKETRAQERASMRKL